MNLLTELRQPFKRHGLLFDSSVLCSNLLLLDITLPPPDELGDLEIAGLLTVAVCTQLLGAILKKPYLTHRLREMEIEPNDGCATNFMGVLLFFHFILFTLCLVLLFASAGIYEMRPSTNSNDVWVIVAFIIAGTTTWLVWRAGEPSVGPRQPNIGRGYGEYLADAALWVSVFLLTHFFWEPLLMEITPSVGTGFSAVNIILIIALSLLFTVFYLPGRYLYFVEDYHSPLTWAQTWLAILPIAWSLFVG